MGSGVGFVDFDGDQDLYLTYYGANVMYRNEGDGRYRDVTDQAAVGDSSWSVGSTFVDYDNDGDLDLYVTNYVHYDLADAEKDLETYVSISQAAPAEGTEAYPHPRNFDGAEDHLFRNEGDGRFRAVNRLAGLVDTSAAAGRGLGVVATDYAADGWSDLYVANDAVSNFLYHNEGDGGFTKIGGLAGVPTGRTANRRREWGSMRPTTTTTATRTCSWPMGTCPTTPRRSASPVAMPSPTSCCGTRDPTGAGQPRRRPRGLRRRRRRGHRRHQQRVGARSTAERGGEFAPLANRDGIGARIEVWAGDLYQAQEIRGSFSYLSQRDMRVSFGLGARTWVDSVRIRWPSGAVERLAGLRPDQFITLVKGKVGRPDPAPGP